MLVPSIAIVWKIMDVLFVKPRDFRISVLEKNVEEIRKEIQKGPTHGAGTNIADPAEVLAPRKIQAKHIDRMDSVMGSTTLLNDMDQFYDSWKDKTLTDLQRDQFEKNYIGQKVVWEANFSSVTEETDGLLWVSLTSVKENNYGHHVIAVFEASHKEALLTINKDELVVVSGVVDSFSLSPLIKKCSVTRKT